MTSDGPTLTWTGFKTLGIPGTVLWLGNVGAGCKSGGLCPNAEPIWCCRFIICWCICCKETGVGGYVKLNAGLKRETKNNITKSTWSFDIFQLFLLSMYNCTLNIILDNNLQWDLLKCWFYRAKNYFKEMCTGFSWMLCVMRDPLNLRMWKHLHKSSDRIIKKENQLVNVSCTQHLSYHSFKKAMEGSAQPECHLKRISIGTDCIKICCKTADQCISVWGYSDGRSRLSLPV